MVFKLPERYWRKVTACGRTVKVKNGGFHLSWLANPTRGLLLMLALKKVSNDRQSRDIHRDNLPASDFLNLEPFQRPPDKLSKYRPRIHALGLDVF